MGCPLVGLPDVELVAASALALDVTLELDVSGRASKLGIFPTVIHTTPLMKGVVKHWASQYPVPKAAPPGFRGLLAPVGLISDRYRALFIPQGSLDMSTSKVNSPLRRFIIS
jgi:hypothetical protein